LHKGLAAGIVGGAYGALYGYTYLAWYMRADVSSSLHFHDEGWFGAHTYAGGADKLGHAWGNHVFLRGISGILQWGGYGQRTSLAWAAGLTASFFLLTEVQDGFTKDYGFSWQDLVVNLAGEGQGLLMELSPTLDGMFDFRLEYFPSQPFRRAVERDGPFNSPEDYTGQRYFLAYHLASVAALRENRYASWTQYLDLAVGFHAAHYKPDDTDSAPHTQSLFLGVSLNLQRLVDRLFMPSAGQRATPSAGARVLRFATEVVQVPYTMVPVVGVSRSVPDTAPEQAIE
jgi:hypothetical protein